MFVWDRLFSWFVYIAFVKYVHVYNSFAIEIKFTYIISALYVYATSF